MRRAAWSRLAAAAVLTAAAVGGGVLLTRPAADPTATRPSPTPPQGTPLARLDTLALVVARGPFCDRVPADAVQRALGGEPTATAAYDSGERARLTSGVRDVAHEFSCAFTGADGATARAWVFAPPVTRTAAKRLAAATGSLEGCTALPGAPAYGAPTVASLCRGDGRTTVAYRGLFGDAWVSCTLETPGEGSDTGALADRAGRWCAAVAGALSA